MRSNYLKTLKTAVLAVTILLVSGGMLYGQQQVNLTAGSTTANLPDGTIVPMWGYSCGAVVAGSTATCAKLNPSAVGWSPVVITVPSGQGLTINLANTLSFPASGVNIPTSLTIVGQLGGGLGTPGSYTASPNHPPQTITWPAAGSDATNTPPAQGPRVQSFSTEVPAGGSPTALTWTAGNLHPGTYLLESGTHPSIQGPMGLYGMVVVTQAPSGSTPGTAYPSVTYSAELSLLFSEIDPVQNNSVSNAVNTAGFDETRVWAGQPNQCGNPSSSNYNTCYPPAVNYSPRYYLINGVAFDRSNAAASLFSTTPASVATNASVLVRLVNAGLRMHVPSIVGVQTGASAASGFALIAEDGNKLPGVPRVQNEVFLAPGKTYDVMINAPAAGGPPVPIFARDLSLSGNTTARDSGMLAYIGVNGASVPAAPVLGAAAANPDTYNSVISGRHLASRILPRA
jgi:FtsP/CotA-like multicopper oxidase with cupredoxin domain